MMKYFYSTVTMILVLLVNGYSQVSLVQFAAGFSSPIDIVNAGDDRIFVAEQAGRIYILDSAGVRNSVPFLDIRTRILSGGERGLLGVAFPPDYASSGYFYVNYTATGHGDTRISRFSVSGTNPDSAVAASEQILLTIYQPYSNHNGGNILFGPDGYLYIGMGDGGSSGDPQNRAQNIDSLLGKILRIDVSTPSYSNPTDNPFVGIAGRDEIWNTGMRNPWRNSFDYWTGDFWIGDVGQNAYEEINRQPFSMKGGNYGWRCYEGNHAYSTSGCGPMNNYSGATYEYAHSGSAAVVGGYVYRGAEYADMFGKYFFTDEFTTTYGFRTLTPNGSGGYTAALLGSLGRAAVVSFGEDRWHELYCADYANGSIYKFKSTLCQPLAYISNNDTLFVCDTIHPFVLRTPEGNGFHYQWYQNGNPVGDDNDTLLVTTPGNYFVSATNRNSCIDTSSTVEVIFSGSPSVSSSGLNSVYCINHAQSVLTGTPAGGFFIGPGLSGAGNSIFNPALAGAGNHTIVYSYTDSVSGCNSTSSEVTFVDLCAGINDLNNIHNVSLYPNPNAGDFTLSFYFAKNEILKIEVLDIIGHQVFKDEVSTPASYHSFPMDLKKLAKGIYSMKISESGGISVKRFVIE